MSNFMSNFDNVFIDNVIIRAGENLGRVIRALYDGVAFRVDGQTFEVYSHEGEKLGNISTADLNFAICYMKRQGRQVGKCRHPTLSTRVGPYQNEPAYTFAWEGWLIMNGVRV